ncbi:MAG: two-component system, OmpR family, sensor kinase [Pseudonocardiales bacterium]|jgi:two-component system OmpR family sensor kinase|nr:two-component system, OmpR family, sensor kinase [Pseudonocardiales bacterium]
MSEIEFMRAEGGQPYTPPPPTVPPPPDPARPAPPDEEVIGDRGQPRPRRLGPRSLTARLVTGVVSLVVVLVLLIGGGTYFALKSFLDNRLDQQLQTTISQGLYRAFNGPPRIGPAPLVVYATALDPATGAVLANPTPNDYSLKAIELSAAQRQNLAARESSSPTTITTADGLQLRITVQPATLNPNTVNQKPAMVVVGLSTGDEQETLHRLFVLEVAIGGAAVVLALLATTYGVQLSLRRLRRVTATAQEVAAELSPEGHGLDRRVPDSDSGTEVGQLAASFNTLLAAVETQFAARLESEQRMRQFLADASHELRTPLTSIRGYAELARMQRAVGNTEDDNLSRIEGEGTRMSRLVEDLLMLARGDADGRAADRELIDVADLLDDAVGGVRAANPDRVIEIQLAGSAHVVGDRDQLVRVVRNLVTNAAVHTRPERPIRVASHADDSGVTIQVADGGPGLPPDEAAHVFERFWRADKARTRARGGSGLGLSIVASIVRSHGGTVRFDSTVEGGSTVTVWLPGAQPA